MDPFCHPLFTPSYTTPTLHVLGRTDVVVIEERSRTLLGVSQNARLEEHDGGKSGCISLWLPDFSAIFPCDLSGHFVPSKGNWRKFLVNYMKDPLAAHASPTAPSDPSASEGMAEASGHGSYKRALTMKL
jgi:hypothetical protein